MTRILGLVTVEALIGGAAAAQDVAQGIALYTEGRYAEAEPVLRAATGSLRRRTNPPPRRRVRIGGVPERVRGRVRGRRIFPDDALVTDTPRI